MDTRKEIQVTDDNVIVVHQKEYVADPQTGEVEEVSKVVASYKPGEIEKKISKLQGEIAELQQLQNVKLNVIEPVETVLK